MPGYEVIIAEQREDQTERLHCKDCKLLLRDPVQHLETGLRFCRTCVDCTDENYVSDKAIQRELMTVVVYCSNRDHGCPWKDQLKGYEEHSKICRLQLQIWLLKQEILSRTEESNKQLRALIEENKQLRDELESWKQLTITTGVPVASSPSSSSLYPFPPVLSSEGKDDLVKPVIPLAEEAVYEIQAQNATGDSKNPTALPHSMDQYESTNIDELLERTEKLALDLVARNSQCEEAIDHQNIKMQHFTRATDTMKSKLASELSTGPHLKIKPMDSPLENSFFYPVVDMEFPSQFRRHRWKIPNVSSEIWHACQHPNNALISPPWYTHSGGYKMKTYVFLQGNGRCRDTDVSVFMEFVRGPDDSPIQGPIQGNMHFFLLDQEKRTHPIVQRRRFIMKQAQASDLIILSGCPDFTPIATLSNTKYVKNDIMLMEFEFCPNR